MVAGMYANTFVRGKIKFIYNCDGPGLLDLQFNSPRLKSILPKYKHIIPDYSVVGLFLNNTNEEVIKAHVKDIYSHNIAYWDINKDFDFTQTTLSDYSKELRNEIKKWLLKYNREDKRLFVENLFYVLDRASVSSIIEIKEQHKKILDIIYESKAMSKKTKTILEDFFNIIIKCYGDATINDFKLKVKEILDFKIV